MLESDFEEFSEIDRTKLRAKLGKWHGLFAAIEGCIEHYPRALFCFETSPRDLMAGHVDDLKDLLKATRKLLTTVEAIAPWAAVGGRWRSLDADEPDTFRHWVETWRDDLRTRERILALMKMRYAETRKRESGRPPKAARDVLVEWINQEFEKRHAPVSSYAESLFGEAVRMALSDIGDRTSELSGILKPYARKPKLPSVEEVRRDILEKRDAAKSRHNPTRFRD